MTYVVSHSYSEVITVEGLGAVEGIPPLKLPHLRVAEVPVHPETVISVQYTATCYFSIRVVQLGVVVHLSDRLADRVELRLCAIPLCRERLFPRKQPHEHV
jgi:hypothetical protein